MSKSPSRRFPVTVTQLPVTRCEICHRTVAYRLGSLSEALSMALTEHYPLGPSRSARRPFQVALRRLPALPRGYRHRRRLAQTTLRESGGRVSAVTERGPPL